MNRKKCLEYGNATQEMLAPHLRDNAVCPCGKEGKTVWNTRNETEPKPLWRGAGKHPLSR